MITAEQSFDFLDAYLFSLVDNLMDIPFLTFGFSFGVFILGCLALRIAPFVNAVLFNFGWIGSDDNNTKISAERANDER